MKFEIRKEKEKRNRMENENQRESNKTSEKTNPSKPEGRINFWADPLLASESMCERQLRNKSVTGALSAK